MSSLQDQALSVIRQPHLTPAQKQLALYQLLEASIPVSGYSAAVQEAVDQGLLHDMFEPAAPFKPRYILPDYEKALKQGSDFLELAAPCTLEQALQFLLMLYPNVPSVTTYPVFLGQLDQLLEPFVDATMTDEALEAILTGFWQALDRLLPDSFVHANLGPMDSRVGRTLLRIDAKLKQSVPNLTFRYQAGVTPDDLLSQLAGNIIACNKPHIAHHEQVRADFPDGDYGLVSCYNSLPIGGGSHTLLRLNLRHSFARCNGSVEDYLASTVPECSRLMAEGMAVRIRFLVEESGFFPNHFLCQEGLISQEKFTAMFGLYGLAEVVNQLMDAQGKTGRYGLDEEATQLGERIVAAYRAEVDKIDLPHVGRPVFHAQSGISSDSEETAGTRIPTGSEPDTVSHIRALAPMHPYFDGGISDIFGLDPTIRDNPQALERLIKGGFQLGLRMFTANLSDNDLVRVTGFLVKKSDIEKYREKAERHHSTALGAEAVDVVKILERQARVLNHEQHPSALW